MVLPCCCGAECGDDRPFELTAHLQSSVKELGGPWQVAANRAWVRRVAEGTRIPADWKASAEAIGAELRALEAEGVVVQTCPKCGGVMA